MNNPKYTLDKENNLLVAVPSMERPDIVKMAIHGASEIINVRLFNEATEKYEAHIKSLPSPITPSEEFKAYAETTPGPYEEGKDFEVKDIGMGEHGECTWCNQFHSACNCEPRAYPIQKAEQPSKDDYEIDLMIQSTKEYCKKNMEKSAPAEPSPLPDNWSLWIQSNAEIFAGDNYSKNHFPVNYDNRKLGFEKGATSVLNKLLPELERLKEQNDAMRREIQQSHLLEKAAVDESQEKDKEISRLKEGVTAFLKWLQDHRPTVTGLGAPIIMLKSLLSGDMKDEPSVATGDAKRAEP